MYNICFSLDNDYCEQLSVAIASILKNSKTSDSFNFFILNHGISEENKKRIISLEEIKDFNIEFINVNRDEFENCPIITETSDKYIGCCIKKPAYFKYKMGTIFKDLDKILYLDCDLIALDSLEELYNFDLKDNYVAMAEDACNIEMAEKFSISNYYNSGVMLVNLKKWREDELEKKFFDCTKVYHDKILWADQDVFNIVMDNQVEKLDYVWNNQFFLYSEEKKAEILEECMSFKIIHFAGKCKPWSKECYFPLFGEYYKYLEMTPFKNNSIKYKHFDFEHLYKLVYKIAEGRIVKENEFFYTNMYKQIEARIVKENEFFYTTMYEQIDARVKKEASYLYDYTHGELKKFLKD